MARFTIGALESVVRTDWVDLFPVSRSLGFECVELGVRADDYLLTELWNPEGLWALKSRSESANVPIASICLHTGSTRETRRGQRGTRTRKDPLQEPGQRSQYGGPRDPETAEKIARHGTSDRQAYQGPRQSPEGSLGAGGDRPAETENRRGSSKSQRRLAQTEGYTKRAGG